ncbi:hypothetical protein QUN99_003431 [Vibrio parahaemolyticus]|nr:hypothetical protein [Vibrio parahaemolyticus]
MCKEKIAIVDSNSLHGQALALADKAEAFAKSLVQEHGTVIDDEKHRSDKSPSGRLKSELLQECPVANCPVSLGDTVTFINDAGVEFDGLTVIGFCEPIGTGRYIHLDTECWWMPKRADQIKLSAKKSSSELAMFLNELADLTEKYGVVIDYTKDDDGLHFSTQSESTAVMALSSDCYRSKAEELMKN